MQYGFVINQETCIGCHACTVACKAENDVPVGSFRTNVKYVEIGKYPSVKRSFLVQRCNHCTNAPCVTICPVNALSKRPDGIVDIDRDACIGCRACMQACPYDALYLNEDLGAVEKCHFCAHRVEKGLQPACVTVCPVGAIVPGDFHDPASEVSLLKRAHEVAARRPEQKTGPNVFYIGADSVSLNPGSAERPRQYLWSDRRDTRPEEWPSSVPPIDGAREVLNAEHKVEWGWAVALYMLTKGIAAGAAIIAPFFAVFNQHVGALPEAIALFFTLVTVFLLIEDLKKPLHFYKLFTRPNWNSWLVKGGIVLTAFALVTIVILVIGYLATSRDELLGIKGGGSNIGSYIEPLRWVNAVLGVFVAGYTAFLFKQCKGRDLWEAPGLFWHLLAQSFTAGAGMFIIVGAIGDVTAFALVGGVVSMVLLHFVPTKSNTTDNYRQAKAFLKGMRFEFVSIVRDGFWLLPVLTALTLVFFALAPGTPLPAVPPALVLAYLFLYERAFVRAGQLPPLS